MTEKENLLLIFTRNPELGKCKTRLAATIGDKPALAIYTFLLRHTQTITTPLSATKTVYYSESIWENDIWDPTIYKKRLQEGEDLGQRMSNAFRDGFAQGYKKIVIIGSDMYDLSTDNLAHAFASLDKDDFVVGPAIDGGYYLLGMTRYTPSLFENKAWGSSSVLKDTLDDIKGERICLLPPKNDIDYYEDLKGIDAFDPFLKK
ncbi:glycosyltransferase [Arenibacter sp. 6A1]|uniref:TIGR04282 family arsenosugar biosynthesis glycosyltransferase n=1 Tax=Arenibacter sp. 6A1 TaxID=2720391 RepID=UPI001447DCD1|nr:TIGR04282 family arsenosugar biosynthesis glycosyltransferase [Arenibacter sp. 6A1]NKI26078.1 glycosyltransferase [Arenibacter sp. 6A1]